MTPEQLALLTDEERQVWERCEAATAGPWMIDRWVVFHEQLRLTMLNRKSLPSLNEANAEMVITAVNTLPALLATIASLRVEMQRREEAQDAIDKKAGDDYAALAAHAARLTAALRMAFRRWLDGPGVFLPDELAELDALTGLSSKGGDAH